MTAFFIAGGKQLLERSGPVYELFKIALYIKEVRK